MNFISVRFLSNPKFCYFFLLLSSFLGLLNSVLLIKEGSLHNYYLERQAGYTLTCIILLIVFHKKIILVLNKVHIWAIKPFDLYPKKCVLLAFLIVVGTFQSKVFLGFWFAGIAGWDYSNYKLKQRPVPDNFQKLSVPKFLQEAVIEQNAQFLHYPGHLPGSAVFLHYSNGQVLPTNSEIFGVVFPDYLLRPGFSKNKEMQSSLLTMIKHNLIERQKCKRFLLPLSIAYPPHTPHMNISYNDYPDAKSLKGVSWWSILVELKGGSIPKVVSGEMLYSIGEII